MSHFGIKKKLKNVGFFYFFIFFNFFFFWSKTDFFFQKKLVRQVIKLEWP